jgi:two-component sensor histidine kinase
MAMLPLGVLGLVQSQNVADETEARAQLAVMGETVRAATPEIRLIRSAQAIAATLAQTVLPLVDDPATCSRMLATVGAQEPSISLVAYVPLSGVMTCASTGKSYDFSEHPLFAKVASLARPSFVVNPDGPVSGTSVLGISHPVFDAVGSRIGLISVSVPHSALDNAQFGTESLAGGKAPVALLTFDAEGTILTASVPLTEAPLQVPALTPLRDLASGEATTFIGSSNSGHDNVFAVVPIADGLFLLGIWPTDGKVTLFGVNIGPLVFPLLMWLAAMTVALWASETLVTRHMRRLGAAMTSFSDGSRKQIDLDLAASPVEIRALGQSFEAMTATILRDEAQLEDALRQKEVLLREVHHRTGNSLQLIASIMRMHMRQEKSATVRGILDDLHDRVMGLATVHMGLYQTTGQKDVRMDQLFHGVIRQITAMGKQSSQKPQITTDFAAIHLIPDQAVPLALLLTELLASIAANSVQEVGTINVSLTDEGESGARLRITGPAIAGMYGNADPTPTVIGTQLVRGFAQQIGGTLNVASTVDTVDVALDFPIKDSNEL